jgi:hypothetical protein
MKAEELRDGWCMLWLSDGRVIGGYARVASKGGVVTLEINAPETMEGAGYFAILSPGLIRRQDPCTEMEARALQLVAHRRAREGQPGNIASSGKSDVPLPTTNKPDVH